MRHALEVAALSELMQDRCLVGSAGRGLRDTTRYLRGTGMAPGATPIIRRG
jgi:hypothetical protein